jgi:hypothetical protein
MYVNEFIIAPQINWIADLPYHEWFIDFGCRTKKITILYNI